MRKSGALEGPTLREEYKLYLEAVGESLRALERGFDQSYGAGG